MDLLERYLQAVGQYLPEATKDDMLAELRVNLLAQMDDRAEELDRPLNDGDVAAILLEHGKPEKVALRYLPQRSLIGPTVFPFYMFTLRKMLPLVVLAYAVAQTAALFLGRTDGDLSGRIVTAVLGLFPVLLVSAALLTLTFVLIEFVISRGGLTDTLNKWNPMELPPVKVEEQGVKPKSMVKRIVELCVHCLWMAYVLLIPYHPFLIMGPGATLLSVWEWALAPVWHRFFLVLMCLLTLQLVIKIAALASETRPWEEPLEWVVKLVSLAILIIMATTNVYFVPAGMAADIHSLTATNQAVGLGFRVVLAINIITLVVDLWKARRRWTPAGKLAF